MEKVCEECGDHQAEEYLPIYEYERNILPLLIKHFQFDPMEAYDIEQPLICLGCWRRCLCYESFTSYVKEFHQPYPVISWEEYVAMGIGGESSSKKDPFNGSDMLLEKTNQAGREATKVTSSKKKMDPMCVMYDPDEKYLHWYESYCCVAWNEHRVHLICGKSSLTCQLCTYRLCYRNRDTPMLRGWTRVERRFQCSCGEHFSKEEACAKHTHIAHAGQDTSWFCMVRRITQPNVSGSKSATRLFPKKD